MMRVFSAIVVVLAMWWTPLYVVGVMSAVYSWRWNGLELLLFAGALDWWLAPTWPLLTLVTMVGIIVAPALRRVCMIYTN